MKVVSPTEQADRAWHALTVDETIAAVDSNLQSGLTDAQAAERLARVGPNRLPSPKRPAAWFRLLLQFHNVLIYVLLASAAGAALLADWVDAGVIMGVVLINAVIGFIQEDKAENALAAIRDLLSLSATVLRDGRKRSMDATALVPGDMVVLEAGDKVPADLRMVAVRNLDIDEAMLTGESAPVSKSIASIAATTVLGDRFCMAYSGTLVTSGHGQGVVVATGKATEIGRISSLLDEVKTPETPLQQQLVRFGRWLTAVILLISAGMFLFGLLVRQASVEEMFMAVVGIAVAAIPEGLPVIVTITLAVGVQRMARRNAIIRQMPAVESLGAVTVICTDKTGTLTRNEMTVSGVIAGDADFAADGTGYEPFGHIAQGGQVIAPQHFPELLALARVALLCNDAVLEEKEGAYHLHGDPTEGALLVFGCRAGLDPQDEHRRFPRKDTIPFESEQRFMATLHGDAADWVFLKGAPEAVLQRCARAGMRDGYGELDQGYWVQRVQALASRGQRVLALAQRQLDEPVSALEHAHLSGGFTLLGLCGLMDPPRDEAKAAVAQCQDAGIRIKMITGDHVLTACAIGDQLHIGDGKASLSGSEIEALDERHLAAAVQRVDIFARTSPEHKLRLVDALQRNGEVVAMTGDGVNDAPALKRADVGVAMGRKGTEAAKEAAAMVLADDNFASIARAVAEGRTIYDNLRKALVYVLPVSFGQAGGIVMGLFLGLRLPITPLQVLWVNMVTAVTLCLTLAFEPPEENVMRRPPRDPKAPLLDWFLVWRVVFVSWLLVLGLLGLFLYELQQGGSVEMARTVAVNTLVAGEIFYLFNSRFILGPALSKRGLHGNRYVPLAVCSLVVAQLLFTYLPSMQALFGTADIDSAMWGRIFGFGVALFVVVEIEKGLVRAFRRPRKAKPKPKPRNPLTPYAWLSIAAALSTIALKAGAYYLTGSVGLLSDALESLVNLAAAVMALAMLMVAARPPDADHHYGHGKAEYFSSGTEGVLVIVAAIGIGVTAYDRLIHPRVLESLDLGLLISALAALLNLAVARVLLRVGRRYRSITLEADARHLLTDVWTSAGVIAGLTAVHFTGLQILDPIIAFLVAFNILWAGVALIRRSVSGLLDQTLPEEENRCIDSVLCRYRMQGIGFHDLRTRQSGVYRFMTVHVLVPGDMTVQAGHDLVERIETDIREALGEIAIVTHLEPLEDPCSFDHELSPRQIGDGQAPGLSASN